jgi:hypothetical protein
MLILTGVGSWEPAMSVAEVLRVGTSGSYVVESLTLTPHPSPLIPHPLFLVHLVVAASGDEIGVEDFEEVGLEGAKKCLDNFWIV